MCPGFIEGNEINNVPIGLHNYVTDWRVWSLRGDGIDIQMMYGNGDEKRQLTKI